MRRRRLAAVSLCLLLAQPAVADALGARLDAVLETRALRGAEIAALVVDEDGKPVYEHSPDRPLIPASNMKLLTALAALHALGPTHRFHTRLLADAAPDAQGAIPELYVQGSGDPALTSEDFWRLASDLRNAGVRKVDGDLVLDDSAFDGRRWHPSWGQTSSRAYNAPIGALTVNYGAFAVRVEPGAAPGDPLRAVVDPPVAYLPLVIRGHTGPARARSTLSVDRQRGAGNERVVVSGVMPAGREARTFERSVLDPAHYAGAVLRLQLESVGIHVSGVTRVGYVPANAVTVLDFEGAPLSDVVRRFLKYSNNQIGEALVKTLGARASGGPGNWSSGEAALRSELEGLGLPLAGAVLVDGSGLSYENRVTPRLLVAALHLGSHAFGFGPEYVSALPIAAADGTLEDRAAAAAGRVRAKTGLLTRVTALSGLALEADGRRLIFSVLVNRFRGSPRSAMDALDAFAETLAAPPQAERAQGP